MHQLVQPHLNTDETKPQGGWHAAQMLDGMALWSLTSPTYFCTSSLPMTLMKHASVRLATARASSVLPVPAQMQGQMQARMQDHTTR